MHIQRLGVLTMMVSYKNDQTLAVPIAEAVHHLRLSIRAIRWSKRLGRSAFVLGTEE
jgi:hypothetical protein